MKNRRNIVDFWMSVSITQVFHINPICSETEENECKRSF